MSLKHFSGTSSRDPDLNFPEPVPLNIKLERGKVLDIYAGYLSMEYTVSGQEVDTIFLGLTNNRLNKKTYTAALGDWIEYVQRKIWIIRRRYRYTIGVVSSNEELIFEFSRPYTIWDTATFVYAISGANSTINHADAQIWGEIRKASDEEIRALQDSQRPAEMSVMANP